MGYLHRSEVELYVVQRIKEIAINPKKLKATASEKNGDSYHADEQIAILNSHIRQISVSLENLYDAIQSGDIKASAVSDRVKNLELQRDKIEEDIDGILVPNQNQSMSTLP